ncbi:AAA family ATPase [Arthrobacter sp. NEB 688]|uniref:AAA family ATPase n=1 Tax=Arthrobacter sp. NEB 688 TaxID=904039 RepID=UPI001C207E04|nr:AAA family ATPase [Arthrobacter sp. NEB 688]
MLLDVPYDPARHRRVVVVGVTGAGKTTFAARLAAATGTPLVATDDLMWRPGWVQLGPAAQVEAVRPHAEGPAWVMDALWSAPRDLVLARTDLLVALDHPRRVSLRRLLVRTLRRLLDREEICGGNVESWRQTFSRDSIILWHQRSFRRRQEQVAAMVADPDGPPVLRFTDPRATEAWLRAVEQPVT